MVEFWRGKGVELMDQMDAITLLYLSKTWDGAGSLLDYAHTFQQTRAELDRLLLEEQDKAITQSLKKGTTF